MKNILLIKLRYLGDVVLCTPLLPLLRKHYPDSKITFLVNPGTEEVLKANPYLDEVWVLPRTSWGISWSFYQQLRNGEFDTVIDLSDGDRSAFLSWITGAPIRLGFNREDRWRGKFYSHILPSAYGSMHMVDYHQQALACLGIHESVNHPEVCIHSNIQPQDHDAYGEFLVEGKALVLLYPTARYIDKAWPLERFAAVADWLGERGVQVGLIGTQNESMIGQQIVNLSKQKPTNLMGKTSFSQLTALMRRSLLLIGNDGGPLHIAAAVGSPVLGLYGPTDPAIWGPRGLKVSVIYKGVDCEQCFHSGCSRGVENCMRQISVEEVCHTVQTMIPEVV